MATLCCFRLTFVLTIALAALLASCESASAPLAGDLRPGGSALIAVPLDATADGEMYVGSGQEVAQAVATAFRRHVPRVKLLAGATFSSTVDPATGASRYDYLVLPSIIQWEDRSMRKSHREGQIEIGIRVLRTRDGVTLANWRITKPSKVSTYFGGSISDQLAEPIREYVDKMFAGERP